MATTSRYYDGDYAVGFYDGPPVITYPFLNNTTPDRYAKQIRRTWLQRGVDYVPTNADRTSWTNLVTYSDQFDNAAWTNSNVSVTANNVTAPDGSATADTITDNSGVSEGYVEQSFTVPNDSATYTVSIFARQGTADTSDLFARLSGGSTVNAEVVVTWATASGYGNGTTLTLTPLADGWYRISFPITNNTSGNVTCLLRYYPSLPGASTASSEVWGAQVVAGTEAGPYIPTTTEARTISAPDLDPGDEINEADPFAYLVAESEQNRDIADTVKVSRLFSRIPATQTRPTSLRISKPSLDGEFPRAFGLFRLFKTDATLARYDAYLAQDVLSDSGVPQFYPTSGTYKLTFDGVEIASGLNYNEASGAVQTALNTLSTVSDRGNVVVTGSYNSAAGFTVTFNDYAQATIDSSGLGGGTIYEIQGSTQGGYIQTLGAYLPTASTDVTADFSGLSISSGITAIDNSNAGVGLPSNQRVFWITTSPYASNSITGGTFTITIAGQTSIPIAYNATIATVQLALDGMAAGLYTALAYPPFSTVQSSENSNVIFIVSFNNSAPTSGTYALTVGADTASGIAYNASAATVQTALNALTSVSDRGGCVVSGKLKNGFVISFSNPAITANVSSLSPTGSSITATIIDTGIGRVQRLVFASPLARRILYIPAHGLTTSDVLYIYASPSYYSSISNFTVLDSDNVSLIVAASDGYASATSVTECGRLTKQNYTPGSGTIRASAITSFYLPGVTDGIDDSNNIPQVTDQGDQTPFLLATFAGAGTINMNVGQLQPWNGTTILSQEITTINAADV